MYDAMLVAPVPAVPVQLTVKLVVVVVAGNELTALVGRPARWVVAWAPVGVGWTSPRLSVATL